MKREARALESFKERRPRMLPLLALSSRSCSAPISNAQFNRFSPAMMRSDDAPPPLQRGMPTGDRFMGAAVPFTLSEMPTARPSPRREALHGSSWATSSPRRPTRASRGMTSRRSGPAPATKERSQRRSYAGEPEQGRRLRAVRPSGQRRRRQHSKRIAVPALGLGHRRPESRHVVGAVRSEVARARQGRRCSRRGCRAPAQGHPSCARARRRRRTTAPRAGRSTRWMRRRRRRRVPFSAPRPPSRRRGRRRTRRRQRRRRRRRC